MPRLSIVIPAKNEAKRIKNTLNWYCSFFSSKIAEKRPEDIEILIVVNDSNDETSYYVNKYSEKYDFVKKISTPYASGKGGAVSLGFEKATGDFIGFTDADGAVSPQEFFKLFEVLEETSWLDGVIGKRNPDALGFKRRILFHFYNFLSKVFFNFPFQDVQCGAKIFRGDVAKELGSRLSNLDWAFDINILVLSSYLNLHIKEIPIVWRERKGSQLTFYEGTISLLLDVVSLKKSQILYSLKRRHERFVGTPPVKSPQTGKNILIYVWRDIKHPEMGGSEIYVQNVAKNLAKENNVFIFTSSARGLDDEDDIDGVKIIRRGGRFTVYLYGFLYYLIFFRKDMDVILDVENGIPFFTPLFSHKPKILVLFHVHGKQWFKQMLPPVALVGFLVERYFMPLIYKNVPVVTISPSSLEEAVKIGFNERRIFLSYPSITEKIPSGVKKSEDPLLLYLGRIKSYKRVELAIIALREVLETYPQAKLVICGIGDYTDDLIELVSKFKLENNVFFKGFVSEEDKWKYMKEAWVHLLPSMKEGWGITVIEAASCGTPTVGFDVGGVRDSVIDGKTGFLARNLGDFIEKIETLISDDDLRNEFGANGRKWASVFSWEQTTLPYSKLIKAGEEVRWLLSERVYPWEVDVRSDVFRLFDISK